MRRNPIGCLKPHRTELLQPIASLFDCHVCWSAIWHEWLYTAVCVVIIFALRQYSVDVVPVYMKIGCSVEKGVTLRTGGTYTGDARDGLGASTSLAVHRFLCPTFDLKNGDE